MTNELYGKPWTINSTHSTYESADKKRKILSEDKDLHVKVKRTPEGVFTVRTRTAAIDSSKKKTKSQGKPKSKSEKRKLREQRKKQKSKE